MTDAQTLTKTLKGKWYGGYGAAPCPICQPERRKGQCALTLSDSASGRLLLHCKKSDCRFSDLLTALGISTSGQPVNLAATLPPSRALQCQEAQKRSRQALQCWNEAQPIERTIGERYLREARGITCDMPDTLRFHPNCWHGTAAKRFPAIVAKVEGGSGAAVHRTYLRADGSGKADVEPAKAMLGAVSSGSVRLTEASGQLVVAEGIETALSLASGLLRRPATIWAALSTSGMRGLGLPASSGRLTIAPDGDKAGREAANALAQRASQLGWSVSLLPAPEGRDWNDVLTMKGAAS